MTNVFLLTYSLDWETIERRDVVNMNLHKGFFRLTVVLSILLGIALPFLMRERYPYTIYEFRREKGEAIEKLNATFQWYGESEPGPSDLDQIFHEAEKIRSKDTGEKVDLRNSQERDGVFIDPLGDPLGRRTTTAEHKQSEGGENLEEDQGIPADCQGDSGGQIR